MAGVGQCDSTMEETKDTQFGVKVGFYRCTLPAGHDGQHEGELQWVEERVDVYQRPGGADA